MKSKLSPVAITVIVLLVLSGISLYIRIALPYDQVFVNGSVWFKGTDAWYHMRLVDNLLHHFPHHIIFDPYTFYPRGNILGWPPFFDLLIAGIARFISFGSPDPHTLDTVGAYVPPILATLTIIPVYFIGKELFNRWVGFLSAALIVILPGEFLNRSLIGFTDHHVAESLFTTVTMLFLILAVKKARERGISFAHIVNKNWSVISKPLIYTLLAGIFLGIYLLTWVGGIMFVFIIFAWLVIQFIIDHLTGKSTDYLCIIGTLSFVVAAVISLPQLQTTWLSTIQRASLAIAIVAPIVLGSISRYMTGKNIKPVYYFLALVILAAIGIGALYAIEPSLLNSMIHKFKVFTPGGASLTILEVHPLLMPSGSFSLQIAWVNFATTFFIAFISLVWLIYLSVKRENAARTLFLVWSIVMLVAVLGQRRFSYYYAINAALLTGYVLWRILDFAGVKELLKKPKQVVETFKKSKKRKRSEARAIQRVTHQRRAIWIKVVLAGVIIFFLVFFPCIGLPGMKPYTRVLGLPVKLTQPLAESPPLIDHAWYDSLLWCKDNTPEPFESPDAYYELYQPPSHREDYNYPESAYSVMSWWDYGHWITRIAHRIPVSNPFQQGAQQVASFFIAQDEDSANKIMDELDSKYVIIDYQMPTSKFYAMPTRVGENPDDFSGVYYTPAQGGKMKPMMLFYPDYYYSTVVRLYNFNGQAVEPKESTLVITYEEKLSQEGELYREITSSKSFASYEEATAYIARQDPEMYKIVGADPFASPVPLEKMDDYELVYKSNQKWQGKPAVKIFEYTQ